MGSRFACHACASLSELVGLSLPKHGWLGHRGTLRQDHLRSAMPEAVWAFAPGELGQLGRLLQSVIQSRLTGESSQIELQGRTRPHGGAYAEAHPRQRIQREGKHSQGS